MLREIFALLSTSWFTQFRVEETRNGSVSSEDLCCNPRFEVPISIAVDDHVRHQIEADRERDVRDSTGTKLDSYDREHSCNHPYSKPKANIQYD